MIFTKKSKVSTKVQRYTAFTLAEVLTVLGIIGVVAAMTIPTLIQNVQQNQWKEAWKKQYSVISQAYALIKEEEGGDLSQYFDATQDSSALPLLAKMSDKISVLKSCQYFSYVCGFNASTPSALLTSNTQYKTLSGDYINYHNLVYQQFVFKDGANFYSRNYQSEYAVVFVDVNGYLKNPNTLGKDMFGLIISKAKIVPFGAAGTGLENTCNATTSLNFQTVNLAFHSSSAAGASCSAEYLYN